jgi:hypothetical protein
MKFGLFGGAKSSGEGSVGDSLGYRKYIDYVLYAEELGYHSVFVVEHHFTGVGQLSASLNFLSYLAGRTQRIRLGTAVVVLPWHNPVLLAEQVATLDLVSNGRLISGGQRLPPAGVLGFASHRGGHRAPDGPAFCAAYAGDRFTPREALALRQHHYRARPVAAASSALMGPAASNPACGAGDIISCSTRSRPSI